MPLRPVTAAEHAAWQLRERGLLWKDVARDLGVPRSTARDLGRRFERKRDAMATEVPAPTYYCMRCSTPMVATIPTMLVCRQCGWHVAYDPRTRLVRPAGYEDEDMARLREILDRATAGR